MPRSILFTVIIACLKISMYSQNSNHSEFEDFFPNTIHYSVFVQSFYDTNNDSIGDLPGLTGKLDYLADLGIGKPCPPLSRYKFPNPILLSIKISLNFGSLYPNSLPNL